MQISGAGSGGIDSVSMQKMMTEMKKKWFDKMDSDGSGGVDAGELSALAETTDKSADAIVTRYDSDKDGSLNATEFDSMMKEMKPKFHPDGMQGPPPPPDDSQTGSSGTSVSSDSIKSLIDLLKAGKEDEAETAWQNMIASMDQNTLYGSTGSDASLFSIKA